jgi:hypothetical protein
MHLLALLALHKAVEAHPAAVRAQLPSFVDGLRGVMLGKAANAGGVNSAGGSPAPGGAASAAAPARNEHQLRQEGDRLDETRRAVVRLALEAQRKFPEGCGEEWAKWWSAVRSEHGPIVRAVEEEGRTDR